MHIKAVHISGFRSYREVAIDNLQQGLTVVVGRNGSGKSNFFSAVQFVLSDEMAHLRPEQRVSVLHESTGPRTMSCRVEITFDNTDRRIPASDADEIRVARQLGQKKDQFFIDGRLVTRTEVVNMMESAGFSRSNPYYIVKQGKVNELATAPDSFRLKLLREVAGTRVYDERKEESLKILRETTASAQRVESLLAYIEERLKTLEEEKEDLKEYQKWDKMKRSIEYTIYDTDIRETRKKLDKLAEQREEMNARQNKVASELVDAQNSANRVAADSRKLEARFKGMREEKEALTTEQTERFEKKTELELRIADLKEDVERERSGRDKAEDSLNQLKADIQTKQDQLDEIAPIFADLTKREADLTGDVRVAEARLKELYAKQGRGQQFSSVGDRDKHLKQEIRFLDRQIQENQEQVNDIERSLEDERNDEETYQTTIRDLGLEIQENVDHMEHLNAQSTRKKQELDAAVVAHLDAGRDEKAVRDSQNSILMDLQQAEQSMRHLSNKAVMNGVDSVRKAVEHFREKGDDDVINGYYGTLLELINTDAVYYQAIEVTAGNRLFYHVVEDDRLAMKLMKYVNGQNLPGEVNFYPLNRVIAKQRKEFSDPDGRPMLEILDFDDRFEVVMRQVFGQTAIVRNMVAGSRIARAEQIDCVTMEGDQTSRRGALTGGYLDAKKSKLELYNNMRQLREQRDEVAKSLAAATKKVADKMSAIEKIRVDIDKINNELRTCRERHQDLTERKRRAAELISGNTRNKEPKQAQILRIQGVIRELTQLRNDKQAELGRPLQSQLTDDEQRLCENLQREVKQKKAEVERVTKERSELAQTKHRIENQLSTNLLRKRENLTAKIQDISVDEKRHNLATESAELQSVINRLKEINKRMAELDEALAEYDESKDRLSREKDDLQEQQKDLEAQLAEFSKQADVICTKQSMLQTKREDAMKKIRELGSLPTDAFSKYQNLSPKQLDKKLAECMNELKKYEHVNKKALDQFVQASTQKEELTKRMDEQRKSQSAIEDLIRVLDQRKYEAIQLTFKQVSANFREVFSKLVPGGTGELLMQMHTGDTADQDMESTPDSVAELVERFVGVGIRVSFTGTSETREMQQLSGGQKSLVALALIFAIQKCDPAPFYLFDEIDAALDQQHRKAVADMIYELSCRRDTGDRQEGAQFIMTTFRPELLANAQTYYGVKYRNKVSHIDQVTKEQAYDFVEDDQTHG